MERISKKAAVELILEEVKKGIAYSECARIFKEKWGIPKSTFDRNWAEANKMYDDAKAKVYSKVEAAVAKREINRTIHELETRDGQIADLIKMIEAINEELTTGMTNDSRWVSDTLVFDKRPMYAKEFNDKRELKARLLADLRKIIGLDAPTKTETGHAFADDFWEALKSGKVKIPQSTTDRLFPKIT